MVRFGQIETGSLMDNSEAKPVLSDNEVPRNALQLTDRQLLVLRSFVALGATAASGAPSWRIIGQVEVLQHVANGMMPGYPTPGPNVQLSLELSDSLQDILHAAIGTMANRYGAPAMIAIQKNNARELEKRRQMRKA